MTVYYSKRHVTIHGALHPAAGHPADNFTVSGIQPLAEFLFPVLAEAIYGSSYYPVTDMSTRIVSGILFLAY